MVTKEEIAKLLDDKLSAITTDLEEIGGRVASIEDGMVTRSDLLYVRKELSGLEKRYTSLQGQVAKMATKKEFARLEKQVVTKKDMKHLENKLTEFFDYLDKDLMGTRKRVTVIEEHLGLPTPSL